MSERDDVTRAIAHEIETYLALHPHAGDTALGIQRYWLSETWLAVPCERVEEALARLALRGLVASRAVYGGAVVYFVRRH